MTESLQMIRRQLKDNIMVMIKNGKEQEAQVLLDQYGKMVIHDPEVFAIQEMIHVHDGHLPVDTAGIVKKKMVFFVKQGLDSFLTDVIAALSSHGYDTKKVIVTQYQQIDEEIIGADICWFEWCDDLIIYASQLSTLQGKKVICRLHSYEAFTDQPEQVHWRNVDQVIFVAEHIRAVVLENVSSLAKEKTVIIPNGIDQTKYHFAERKAGFNIGYVGYINYKKGPMLLLHTFKAIYDQDHRYKLYIAGNFQDQRDVLYYRQMIHEMGLSNNVIYEGWQDDVNQWLEDKNYLISTSVLEGHPFCIMEAMSKGIKPLIHNFVGAKGIYPEKYIWNTIPDCIKMLDSPCYNSTEYQQFIADNYSIQLQNEKIRGQV